VSHARLRPFHGDQLPLPGFIVCPVYPVLEPHPPRPFQSVPFPGVGADLRFPDLLAVLHRTPSLTKLEQLLKRILRCNRRSSSTARQATVLIGNSKEPLFTQSVDLKTKGFKALLWCHVPPIKNESRLAHLVINSCVVQAFVLIPLSYNGYRVRPF